MEQRFITWEEQLAAIKRGRSPIFKPRVRSFEEFNTLESLCGELAKRLDSEAPRDGLEPYCGVPLAQAMASLCQQLFDFEYGKDATSEDTAALRNILNEYISGAAPFIRLSEAYGLSEELGAFMRLYPDPLKLGDLRGNV